MQKDKQRNKKAGFSLVETLVAISILMVSIAGPMVLVGNGIRYSAFARDQITAFYLAQDAIEAVRYIRDGNRIDIVIDGYDDWDYLPIDTCDTTPCRIDTTVIYNNGSGITTLNHDQPLRINTSGIYNYTSGTPTKFKRWITLKSVDDKEVEVEVTVDWSSGIFTRSFSIKENLFYWY